MKVYWTIVAIACAYLAFKALKAYRQVRYVRRMSRLAVSLTNAGYSPKEVIRATEVLRRGRRVPSFKEMAEVIEGGK